MLYDFPFTKLTRFNRWIGAVVKIKGYTGLGVQKRLPAILFCFLFSFFFLFFLIFHILPYTQIYPPIVQCFILDKIEQ